MSVGPAPFCHETDQMELVVLDYIPGIVVTGDQTICYQTAPTQLEVTAASGGIGTITNQWQVSTDNVTFVDILGETGLIYLSTSKI